MTGPSSKPQSTDASTPAVPDAATSALCADSRRALIALLLSFALPTLASVLLALTPPAGIGGSASALLLFLVGWNIFVIAYVILTFRTFARVDSAEFRARMDARGSKRPVIWRVLTPRGDGPTLACESAVVAFAVVLVLPHVSAINIDDWVLVPASISILLSCWTLSLVSYACTMRRTTSPNLDSTFPAPARTRSPTSSTSRLLWPPRSELRTSTSPRRACARWSTCT